MIKVFFESENETMTCHMKGSTEQCISDSIEAVKAICKSLSIKTGHTFDAVTYATCATVLEQICHIDVDECFK